MVSEAVKNRTVRMLRCLNIATVVLHTGCGARQYVREFSADSIEVKSEFLKEEQVTAGNEANYAPELSPNGEFVLFVSERSGNKDVWEKRAIGGFFRQLTGHAADDFSPAMSPDGKRIVFITRRSDAAGNIALTTSNASKFSFTSKFLDSNTNEVVLPDSEEMSPSWFPDGKKIVFTSRQPGEIEPKIMTVEVSGVDPRPLFNWSGSSPMISPKGNKAVFVKDGAIYLGSFNGKARRLTKGGNVKDGQPRFTKDGSSVVFIRYTDDSNSDGTIDGKDFGAVWQIAIETENDLSIDLQDLRAEPLTQADKPHYFPEERPPFLYFTMQNNGNLDIYRLPNQGPIKISPKLDEALRQFEKATTYHQKSFVLRKAKSLVCRKISDECGEVLLRELRWLVQEHRVIEARLVASQINAVFPKNNGFVRLAEVALIDQRVDPLNLFDQKVELDAAQKQKLKEELSRLEELVKSSPQSEKPRIEGQALLVTSKIYAAMRQFSDAVKTLGEIQKKYKSHGWLAAEGAYLSARLTPYLGDKSNWVESLRNVVASYPDQEETIHLAAKSAVAAIDSEDPNRLEQLAGLRDRSKDLKFLAAEAHLAIAKEYEKRGKLAVAQNEYRQIVKLYTKDPELQLQVAERLAQDLERTNRGEEAEEMLQALYQEKKGTATEPRSLALLQDHLVRRGEGLLREREAGQAIKLYRRVLDTDPEHVAANRGMIDGAYSRKTLDPLLPDMEVKASAADANARTIYAYGYALTYKIDVAKSDAEKLSLIDECIGVIEKAREGDGQILQIHQTLGWLYLQKDFYTRKVETQPGFSSSVNRRVGIIKEFFGVEKPNYLEMSVDAYLLAYSLSQDNSVERANLDLNLGNAYFELHNYPKALEYFSKRIRMLSSIPVRDLRAEALLFRSAGRSAFYSDELPYAELLQKRAISAWEQVASDRDIAYSIDALALTLREEKKFKDALILYDRLLKLQAGLGDKRNSAQTHVNLAYTLFLDGQYERALASFNEAEGAINLSKQQESTNGKSDRPNEDESIKVDIGGEGSAAKGLDEFLLRDLIVTTRYQIYLQAGYGNEADVQLERKLNLLKSDKSETMPRSHDEERAITINRRAVQLFRQGRLKQAAEEFRESARIASSLCKDKKVNCRDEGINILSLYRVQLLRARLGNIEKNEKGSVLKTIGAAIEDAQERAAAGSRLDVVLTRKLRQMRLAFACSPASDDVSKPMAACTDGIQDSATKADVDYLKTELTKNDMAPEDSERIQATLRLFRPEPAPPENPTWSSLVGAGQGKEALVTLVAQLKAKPRGLSIAERMLALQAARLAAQSQSDTLVNEALRLYDELRFLDLSNRLGLKNEKSETLTAPQENPLNYQKIYVLQLKPNEVLASTEKKFALGRGNTLAGAATAALSELEGALGIGSGKRSNIYIVPLDHTAELGLASLVNFHDERVQISEAPSAFVIDGFEQRKRIAKTQVKLVGFDESQLKGIGTEVHSTPLLQANNLSLKTIEDADLTILRTRVTLNDSEVSASNIGMVNGRAAEKFEQIPFADLQRLNLQQMTAIFFDRVEYEDPARTGLSEGWVGLSLLLYQSGAATIIIPCSGEIPLDQAVITGLLKVSAAEFSKMQTPANGNCTLRVIGNPGIHSAAEAAFALQSLDDRVDKAEAAVESSDWNLATRLWREASFFSIRAKSVERMTSIQKQGLQAALKARLYKDALFFQENIIAGLNGKSDAEALLNARVDLAKISVKAEAYGEADKIFLNAINTRQSQDNKEEVAKLYQFLAVSSQGQKNYDAAANYFTLSHNAFKEADEVAQAAGRLVDAANVQKDALNEKQKALELYQKAEDELKNVGEADDAYWSVAVDRSNTLVDLGRIREALDTFESLAVKVQDEKVKLKMRVLQGLSNAYFRAGMFQKSAAVNASALTLVKQVPDAESKAVAEIDALNLQGYLQAKLGDSSKAFQTFDSALDIAKQFGLKGKQAILLNNIGFWQRETGDVYSSVAVFNDALSLDRELKSKSGIAFDLRNLGMSQILLGQYDLARENLEEALKLSKEARVVYNEAYCEFALGDLFLRRNDLQNADTHLQAATQLAKASLLTDFYWRGLAALAKVRGLRKQPEEAIQLYNESIAIIESLRAGLQSESFRSGFQSDRGVQSVYQDLVSLLMQKSRAKEAWSVSERSRARAFIDSIGSQNAKLANVEAQKMLGRIDTIKSQIASLSGKGETSAERIQKLKQEVAAIETSDALHSSGASQLAVVEIVSVEELTKLLGQETALIEYMVTDEEVFIWIIKSGVINGVRSPLKGKDLRALVDQNRELTSNFSSLDYNGKALATGLIEPIKALLQGSRNIVIVPHGVLHYLSIAALPFDGEFLIDHFNIEYLESASLAKFLAKPRNKKPLSEAKVVALGNPAVGKDFDLPFAEKEVSAILRYFPKATALVGRDATKTALLKLGQNSDILHIASHGEFNERLPSESKLRLMAATGESGDLTVQDVLALRLDADLVTLSACETGLGKILSGDEIVGLNRAFFLAGAHSIISSLWRISDVASAVAMKRFYRNLSEGDSVSQAMKKAQLLVRQYYPHPAYWASFRVLGVAN